MTYLFYFIAIKVAKKPILTKVVKKVVFPKLPTVKVVTHKTIVHKPIHKLPAVKPIHKTTTVHKVVTHKKPLIVKPHTATKKITITHHKTATHPKLVIKVPVVHHKQHPVPAPAKPETHLGVIFRTIMHAVKGTLHKGRKYFFILKIRDYESWPCYKHDLMSRLIELRSPWSSIGFSSTQDERNSFKCKIIKIRA